MAFQFEYSYVSTATGILEIDNPGQCAIRASNAFGEEYYMVIRTSLGTTYLFMYGPIIPDLELLPSKVICSVERFSYNDKRLQKIISTWLTDPKKAINKAEEVEDTEVFESCRDLIKYMSSYTVEKGEY